MSQTLAVGNRASIIRSYTADDIRAFLGLAGSDTAAADTVPEPLIGALFSYLLGVELPGFGTNYLKQEMSFEAPAPLGQRSEEHTSELQSLMRISYAVFCLKKKQNKKK